MTLQDETAVSAVSSPAVLAPKDVTPKVCEEIGVLLNHLNAANRRRPVIPKPTPSLLWMRTVTTNSRLFVVKDSAGRIVGMATLHSEYQIGGYCGIVHEVSVHPQYEGRGVATSLMRAIHDVARELGMKKIKLTSSKLPAQVLYLKLGYQHKDPMSKQMYFDLSHAED